MITTNANEVWKIIPDYPKYEVSNYGRVRSFTGKKNGKLLKNTITNGGYLQVNLQGKTKLVHTLVLLTFEGERPEGKETRHLNGNQKDNTLTNLTYGTPNENHKDKIEHGTTMRGEKHPLAKLTTSDIQLVRLLLTFGWSQTTIAKIVETTNHAIFSIKEGRTWSHLPPAPFVPNN